MIHLFKAMRPEQWTKNLVVFAGLVFSGRLLELEMVIRSGVGFLMFCLLSGSVYLINDIVDLPYDRLHPRKKHRAIASGKLSPSVAKLAAVVLAIIGVIGCFVLDEAAGYVGLSYLLLVTMYTLILKKIGMVDVMVIAIGFVLRAVAGVEFLKGADPNVDLSPWLLVCTFFLALFMGLGKRKHEAASLGTEARQHRKVLAGYASELTDGLIWVTAGSTMVSYSIYTIWPETVEKVGNQYLLYTIPFVSYGIFRYLTLVFEYRKGDRPGHLLITDPPIMIDALLWILVVAAVLYI
jgi:4-hydroxybenzoate polyprenyltransferase